MHYINVYTHKTKWPCEHVLERICRRYVLCVRGIKQNGLQGGKFEAPGLPEDRFWTSTLAIPVSEVTAISENAIKTDIQKPTCCRTFHKKKKPHKTTNNQ